MDFGIYTSATLVDGEELKYASKVKRQYDVLTPGWPKIEEALGNRKYTVFAGHVHHYGNTCATKGHTTHWEQQEEEVN